MASGFKNCYVMGISLHSDGPGVYCVAIMQCSLLQGKGKTIEGLRLDPGHLHSLITITLLQSH